MAAELPNGAIDNAYSNSDDAHDVNDPLQAGFGFSEDEHECRVCRGPAEEGNPLIAPCKCSGSIGFVHQECLVSWLDVTRGDGRCELCKTKFRFHPQYAENTPDRLPTSEVVLGLSSRFLAGWLPVALRIALAITCWLIVAPFLTACLYHGWVHGWMHRPSSILVRLTTTHLIPSDIISGTIIAAFVIISFLSIMSFADFLRVHWQDPAGGAAGGNGLQRRPNARNNNNENADNRNNEDVGESDEGRVDNIVMERITEHKQRSNEYKSDNAAMTRRKRHRVVWDRDDGQRVEQPERRANAFGPRAPGVVHPELYPDGMWGAIGDVSDDDLDSDDLPDHDSSDDEDDVELFDEDELNRDGNGADVAAPPPRNDGLDANPPPFDPLDPVFQDDQADMEINVALDELLGIRGPPSTLIRNLLWLLAFNATYLAFFAFVPRTIGSAVYMGIFNTTSFGMIMKSIPYVYSEDANITTFHSTVMAMNQVSEELNTTFRFPDIATMILGYFSFAFMITVMRFAWTFSQMFRRRFSPRNTRLNNNARHPGRNANWQEIRMRAVAHEGNEINGQDVAANTAISVALDASVAIVKVGVLLFLKMFALPEILGLALDASTVTLLGQSLEDRIYFAGSDLFSFVLLHWVAGITFMLLVTVFLLQLREVMHPDVLARVIRPQEPHPDLLGNLMNETVATHIKRMLLSLAIYAPILILHITLPVQFLLRCGTIFSPPFYQLHFWHAMKSELQIPLELIIFHLSMLALLEKYKNTIGRLQHNWLKLVCGGMGLTDYLLAHSVEKFELVGTKSIFHDEAGTELAVDKFWYDLAKQKPSTVEAFVEGRIKKLAGSPVPEAFGETTITGQRVYSAMTDSIKLPNVEGTKDVLLPTAIGPFRLNVKGKDDPAILIEFWREVRGSMIARPPDGWDDLGAGGAFVQGRWAWGQEKPSVIERGVAVRKYFRHSETQRRPSILMAKVVLLLVLSWLAVVSAIFSFVSVPLLVGRSLYFLFRVDSSYIHDPFAFVIGGCLVFPGLTLLASFVRLHEGKLAERFVQWLGSFRAPPPQKFFVLASSVTLWCFVAPMALGLSYELAVVKDSPWFQGTGVLVDLRSCLLAWMAGATVLNTWAFFAYFSVFTRQFWSNIGNGMLEPPVDDNGNPLPPRNPANEVVGSRSDWQGRQGRVSQFFGVWKAGIIDWEWEKVDRMCLLDEFSIPISRQLSSSLVGSMLSFILVLNLMQLVIRVENGKIPLPFLGEVERGVFRQLVFRICMISHVLVQLCSSFRGQLESWFESAHNSAKDARYLIGEILMNYEGDTNR